MSTVSTIHEIPRDRFGRPLVIPPGGGKAVPYTRCTTFVDCLEDKYNLQKWMQRMVAVGLSESPDLVVAVASTNLEDKQRLNSICEDAMERAKSKAKATIGTALHAFTERMDRGEDVGVVPEEYKPDLAAYAEATKDLTAVAIEEFSVQDDLRIGGTPDRIVEVGGELMIADLKTGESMAYGMGKIAMQLAVYAHSVGYDHTTGERAPARDINTECGIVIHLPAGSGRAELLEVDLTSGWGAVKLAAEVRQWRARRDLSRPFTPPVATKLAPGGNVTPSLADRVASATTVQELRDLWRVNASVWTTDLTELAKARTALIEGSAVATTH